MLNDKAIAIADKDREIKNKIYSDLEKIYNKALNQIIIEFFTINLFLLIKNKLKELFINEVNVIKKKLHSTSKYLKDNTDLIDKKIKKKFNYELDQQLIDEANDLKLKFIHLFKQRVKQVFSDPNKLKFRLKITRTNKVNELTSDNSKPTIKVFNVVSRYLFKNSLFCKLYCPNLLYKIDYNKYGNLILKTITKDGTFLNNLLKSLTGIVSSIVLAIIIYFYFRYISKTEAIKAAIFLIILFIILIYGLAFNNNRKFRAIILLIIPFMASNRTKGFLVLNCCVLSSSIIIPNIFQNIGSLKKSYTCNLNMLNDQVEEHANKDENSNKIKKLIKSVKTIKKNVGKKVNEIKKVQKKMIKHSKKIKKHLDSVTSVCQKSTGDPVKRCANGMNNITQSYHPSSKQASHISVYGVAAWASPFALASVVSFDATSYILVGRAKGLCDLMKGPQAVCTGAQRSAAKVILKIFLNQI